MNINPYPRKVVFLTCALMVAVCSMFAQETTSDATVDGIKANVSNLSETRSNGPKDMVNPSLIFLDCPDNIALPTEGEQCGTIVYYEEPSYSGGVLSIEGLASGSMFYVGETTITYTVTHYTGISISCSFTITIYDDRPPVVECPATVNANTISGSCFANNIQLQPPVVSNTCNLYTMYNNAPAIYYPGTTTITWTVNNANGMSSVCQVDVVVVNNHEPTLICPTDQTICATTGSASEVVNNINPLIVEPCPYILLYRLNGATTDTGTCMGSGGISGTSFNIGETTVTYEISRLSDLVSASCSFKVTVLESTPIFIDPVSIENFCNTLTLSVTPYSETASYEWSNGFTSPVINLSSTDPEGLYSVTVTDLAHCNLETIASYEYVPQDHLNSYTILAFNELEIGDFNEILSGSAGLTGENRMAHFKKYTKVTGPGAFVRASAINAHSTSIIPNKIFTPAVAELPQMYFNTTSGFSGVVNVPDNSTMTINNNNTDLNIGRNCTIVINGNVYGKIDINKGSTVTFTAGSLDIQELDAKMADSSEKTQIRFTQDAKIRIPKTIRLQENCIMNPDHYNVVFYIGQSTANPGELEVFPLGTTFNASAYAPFGQIHVQHDASTSQPGFMNGKFIANKVISNGKFVFWNWRTCEPTPANAINPVPTTSSEPISNVANIQVYPNPFKENFSIDIIPVADENLTIEVFNITGQKVLNLKNQNLQNGVSVHYDIEGNLFNNSGLFFIKYKVGDNEFMQRLIKL